MFTKARICLFISLFFSTLSAHYTHYPFSVEWQEAEKLQGMLVEKFGTEKPFADYLATLYTLLVMQEKFHRQWLATKDDKVKKLLKYAEDLLISLQDTSHNYLKELSFPPAQTSSETPTSPTPPAVAPSNDTAAQFFAVLQTAQHFLDEQAPLYLNPTKPREQGQPIQLVPQPTWPPTYPWPPQGPYPQPYPPGQQVPPSPEFDHKKWKTIALVGGVIGGILLVCYILKDYFASGLSGNLNEVKKKADENDAAASKRLQKLEELQTANERFIDSQKERLNQANNDLLTMKSSWKSSLEEVEKKISAYLQEKIQPMNTKLNENRTIINSIQTNLSHLKVAKEECEKALIKINNAMIKHVDQMRDISTKIEAFFKQISLSPHTALVEKEYKKLLEKLSSMDESHKQHISHYSELKNVMTGIIKSLHSYLAQLTKEMLDNQATIRKYCLPVQLPTKLLQDLDRRTTKVKDRDLPDLEKELASLNENLERLLKMESQLFISGKK